MSPEIHTAVMHNTYIIVVEKTKGHIGTSGVGSSENVSSLAFFLSTK